MEGLIVQWVLRIRDNLDQVGRKSCHHMMSSWASWDMQMWWWKHSTIILKSIRRCKKMQPAGTTLQANESLPTRESNWCFVHFFQVLNDCSSSNINDLHSSDMLAVIFSVSITIPKNVILVVGGTTFSSFTGALICWQRVSMDFRFCWHTRECGGPAVKKSSK